MDRRSFLVGLFGMAGAATVAGALASSAKAMPLVAVKDAMGKDANPLPEKEPAPAAGKTPTANSMAAPDGTPIEAAQWHRAPPPHRRRPARRVCRTYRDRWGRRFRRCWWV